MKRAREYRENEKRRIFADAYGENAAVQTYDEDYAVEEYIGGDPYECSDDLPYFDIDSLIGRINMLTGNEFQYYLEQNLYGDLKSYVKKIQKRPDIRDNFTYQEWAAIERYINDEEFKYANT